jgi:hypothetical protein
MNRPNFPFGDLRSRSGMSFRFAFRMFRQQLRAFSLR